MWAVKWVLAVLIILVFLGFALNNNQEVTVRFLGDSWQSPPVQLWLVIYISFALGVFFWLVVSIFQVMQLKGELRRMQKKNQDLQHELESLRNLPISEEDASFDISEEG